MAWGLAAGYPWAILSARTEPSTTLGWVGSFAILATYVLLLLLVLFTEKGWDYAEKEFGPIGRLLMFLTVFVNFVGTFALAYWSASQSDGAAFNEHLTKLDAVYFAVTTLTTTGFGDVQPHSQSARLLVTIQMSVGFVLVVLAIARGLTLFGQRRDGG